MNKGNSVSVGVCEGNPSFMAIMGGMHLEGQYLNARRCYQKEKSAVVYVSELRGDAQAAAIGGHCLDSISIVKVREASDVKIDLSAIFFSIKSLSQLLAGKIEDVGDERQCTDFFQLIGDMEKKLSAAKDLMEELEASFKEGKHSV